MKTVLSLYFFLFIACFDLHAQSSILSPFALALGATPAFIGILMGVYAVSHIPAQLIAGRLIDKHGSRLFIAGSLCLAGLLLLTQALLSAPWQLLIVRALSGFVLAFLSPACQVLLAMSGANARAKGNLMSGNGFVQMLASIAAPGLGALFVAIYGFQFSFLVLGATLVATGLLAFSLLSNTTPNLTPQPVTLGASLSAIPFHLFAIPLALAFSQAILYYELPLRDQLHATNTSTMLHNGIDFAWISVGATVSLSMIFLNRFDAWKRTVLGASLLAMLFYVIAIHWSIPFVLILFMIGLAKGIIYPAVATMIATSSDVQQYGRMFALLSISYSIGAFLGPLSAGLVRNSISPYFLGFLCLFGALIIAVRSHWSWSMQTNADCQPVLNHG
jgi:MFS family permease